VTRRESSKPVRLTRPGTDQSPTLRLIESLISGNQQELRDTAGYPLERLVATINEIGFECDCCTRCCTSEFNGHVFLLDQDAGRIRQIDKRALIPAPGPEFCDQDGSFYVSGYALRIHPDGSCIFLTGNRCRCYAERPEICRVYPYMIRREADSIGIIEWRQISGLNEHGTYHNPIPLEESRRLARITREYECRFLAQEIAFLKFVHQLAEERGLCHIRRVYDAGMRDFHRGGRIRIFVWNGGGFDEWMMQGPKWGDGVPVRVNPEERNNPDQG
jgi:Fe-S-cluster containining protein